MTDKTMTLEEARARRLSDARIRLVTQPVFTEPGGPVGGRVTVDSEALRLLLASEAEVARLREALKDAVEGVEAAMAMVEQRDFMPDWDWLRSVRAVARAALSPTTPTDLPGAVQ